MPLLPKLSNIFKARKDRADETQSLYEEFLPGQIHQSIVLENNNNNNAPPIPHRKTSQLIDALDLALPVEAKVDDQIPKKGLFRRFIGRLIPRRFKAKKRLDLADPAKMLKTCLHYHQIKEAYPGSFSHIFVIRKTKREQKLICKVGKFGPDSRKFSVFGDSYDEYIRESNAFAILKPHPNIVKYDSTAQVYLPTGSDDPTQAFSIFTNEQLSDSTLLMSVTVIEKLEMSLTEWIDTNQMTVLNEEVTKAIFEQIGGALRHCHAEHFLCHKDLKSDNIAVVRNFGLKRLPHLKLIDFGVAHIYTAELYAQAREQASNFLLVNTNEQDVGTSNFVCLKKSNNAFLTESFKFANMLVRLSHARTNDQISDKTFKRILFTMAPATGVEQVTVEWALENLVAN